MNNTLEFDNRQKDLREEAVCRATQTQASRLIEEWHACGRIADAEYHHLVQLNYG